MDLWLLLFTMALASANSSFSTMKPASGQPHIIQCRSPEMETFSCYWYTDYFPLELEPGKIQLLYSIRSSEGEEWKDCPDYTTSGENSCYFNKSFTSIWVPYSVRLYIADQLYDEKEFRVEDIVIPDPPIGLNWTVLNISPSGVYTDIKVRWNPPLSADVDTGWLIPFYQLQFKDINATEWHELDPKRGTEIPVYSLKTCHDYEIRVRAKGTPEVYGEFSDVLYVSFDSKGLVACEEEFQIPWPVVLAFGILGLMVMLSIVFFSKQQKLKILIFPPVPVPKIKGIDPDLLKKGKLDEVNSILASHGSYMPQLYGDDSWVEFIELDIDDAEDRTEGSDTERLLGGVHTKSHGCLAVRDDDSGRASCCEPDIPETDFSASDTCDGTSDIDQSKKVSDKEEDLLCLDQKDSEKSIPGLDDASACLPSDNPTKEQDLKPHVPATEITSPLVQTQLSNQSSLGNIDFYTQVSNITPRGSVVLSPGQKMKTGKAQSEAQREAVAQCQPTLAMDNAYFCELDVKKCATVTSPKEDEPEVQVQSFPEDAYLTTESFVIHPVIPAMVATAAEEKDPEASEIPVADYTSIHMVQSPQGLLLNATALHVPDKEFIMSSGYVSTEQLNKILS
ncbi:growth hormone receptor isoform X1 [Pantherophis guttatus]|uniref:Growth hormone receptor n=1 Tax=Pantherophis guttatus TaxID=94885 RepID=A0A6P9DLJ5_PANGU|nr:growth hormone receptor isoform X1 [Pantherophis guttatus]XP_034296704.1 growth hormone receptor isoform X1 [Pantherophis guttatus]XP_034296705.1 growth hormone receptor isoform X1 [Pantherophis guttatus]